MTGPARAPAGASAGASAGVPTGVPADPDTSDAALRRVTDALAANAERYDRSAEFPWESIHAVHAAGLLTLGIGPAYGGRELPATEAARVLQALGRGDPSVALLTAMTVFQHVSQARLPRWPVAARCASSERTSGRT